MDISVTSLNQQQQLLKQRVTLKRHNYGKTFVLFNDCTPSSDYVNIDGHYVDEGKFERQNLTESESEAVTQFSSHEVNVQKLSRHNSGMNHVEGGWPRDILHTDLEQTMRFRKKTEKDVDYSQITAHLGEIVQHGVTQNNSLKFYRKIYNSSIIKPSHLLPHSKLVISTVLRDPLARSIPVSSMSWSSHKKLASGYFLKNNPKVILDHAKQAFVWDIGNSPQPEISLYAQTNISSIEFNPKDPSCLVGGCTNGQIMYWDVKSKSSAVLQCFSEEGHQHSVTSILFLNSKSGMEFFSASIDGMICWWDIRTMKKPTDSLFIDCHKNLDENGGHSVGASFLEFEPTMSTKFMVGTEAGNVLLCNSKAKSLQEKFAGSFNTHLGPVLALQRNSMYPKNFLTVGDSTAKIWSEDVRESPLFIFGPYPVQMTAGCWSHTKPSTFFTTTENGYFYVWDFLFDYNNPAATLKVSDVSICNLRVQDSGCIVACGMVNGNIALVNVVEEYTVLTREEKCLLANIFERETHREKILDARRREQKLWGKNDIISQNKANFDSTVEELTLAAECQFHNCLSEEQEENLKKDSI